MNRKILLSRAMLVIHKEIKNASKIVQTFSSAGYAGCTKLQFLALPGKVKPAKNLRPANASTILPQTPRPRKQA